MPDDETTEFAMQLRQAQREGGWARREVTPPIREAPYEDEDLAHAWFVGWDGADGELERLKEKRR